MNAIRSKFGYEKILTSTPNSKLEPPDLQPLTPNLRPQIPNPKTQTPNPKPYAPHQGMQLCETVSLKAIDQLEILTFLCYIYIYIYIYKHLYV